ncbi:MAG: hypothetical protein KJ630_17250 [Proteobacteria bacterium]|nr:hypothetical protein [Pseudomonadota bacterium]
MIIGKIRQPFLLFLLILVSLGSLATSIALNNIWNEFQLVNDSLHAAFEAFGGVAAIAMALLLLQLHQERKRASGEYFLLSMGFMMMGILDTCHAVSNFGYGFILLRSLASLCGSLWFAMLWLPSHYRPTTNLKTTHWAIVVVSLLLGLLILKYRNFFPLMIQDGHFTPFSIGINVISGILSIAAALYFLIEFLRGSKKESYLFTCMFLILGLSALEFPFSTIWSYDWWFWHVQRCLAYTIVLYYIFRTFLRISEELKESNERLEERITERTAELSNEVAERKRYGVERDEVITQLQDALEQIKTLTGLLSTCASCKNIRDTEGHWVPMECYIQEHSDARFSHGICPECAKKLYPEVFDKKGA